MAAAPCNPASTQTCALPFPSDYWSAPSAQSPTGRVLNITDNVLPAAVLDQLTARDVRPSAILNGDSGFSPASPVLFEFGTLPASASMPNDGGDAVKVFNLRTGEVLEIRAELRQVNQPWTLEKSGLIEVFPRTRWPYGDQLLAVVTGSLDVLGESSNLQTTLARSADQTGYAAELARAVAATGLNPSTLRSATLFTVRDRNEVIGPMINAVADTYRRDHPVRDIQVSFKPLDEGKLAVVTGDLRLDIYREDDGRGNVNFSAKPTHAWVPFRLTLPPAAEQGMVPVALYGHGLTASRNLDAGVEPTNSRLGIATFGIDYPNLGARATMDGGFLLTSQSPRKLPLLFGMLNQSIIDMASAQKALQSALSELDVVGARGGWLEGYRPKGDGVPDLDTRRLMLQGTSLGGVLGATYAPIGPGIEAALLPGTGSGMMNAFYESVVWNMLMQFLVPSRATAAETLFYRNLMQQAVDHADSLNYVDLMRNRPDGSPDRPLLVLSGLGDSIISNNSTIATARLAQLPVVGEVLYPVTGVEQREDYDEGFGLRQYLPILDDRWYGDNAADFSTHFTFLRAEALEHQEQWLKRYFLKQ